jgi:hypothetical protein
MALTPEQQKDWDNTKAQMDSQQSASSVQKNIVIAKAKTVPRPNGVFSDDVWSAALDFTVRYEGIVPYMYNDAGAPLNVTYGIGVKRDSTAELHRDGTAFFHPVGNDRLATIPEVDADETTVEGIQRDDLNLSIELIKRRLVPVNSQADIDINKQFLAHCFEFATQLRMTSAGIGLTMARKLAGKVEDAFRPRQMPTSDADRSDNAEAARAAARLVNFKNYPYYAQVACICFWYGCVAFKAPNMTKALAVMDFDEARYQCWRSGVSPIKQRNLCMLLFNAARMWEQAHVPRKGARIASTPPDYLKGYSRTPNQSYVGTKGEWEYDPDTDAAQTLPTYDAKGNVIAEFWQPWTEGIWNPVTNQQTITTHDTQPPEVRAPSVSDPNPDKASRPFKYAGANIP